MIPVTKSYMPPLQEYMKYMEGIWEKVWLTNRGPLALELEKRLCEYLGVPHLLFVSNGTIALQIAIKALGLKGEIITTPFSYVATTSSIVWEGCTPVFVDIDPLTLCIDPAKIEEAITEKTSAILATHVYGIPCDVEMIEQIAGKHGLKVIYDAAHCFGVKYKGESILNFGDVSTISFHATKLFHTGEGGGIIAKDKALQEKIFHMHNFGHINQEEFVCMGINGKNSEFHAALGLCVLSKVDFLIEARKERSLLYDDLLMHTSLKRPIIPEYTDYNYSYYPVIFSNEERLRESRDLLNKNNIFPRRYFYPCLKDLNYVMTRHVPVADNTCSRVLCLPLYYDMDMRDIKKICEVLSKED